VVSRTAEASTGAAVVPMSAPFLISREETRARAIRELHELVAALDRRVPQVQRLGEVAIARTGAALRAAALRRIDELERAGEPISATIVDGQGVDAL
jgi:hypothetical protein